MSDKDRRGLRLVGLVAFGVAVALSSQARDADGRRFTVRDSLEIARFGVDENSEPNEVDDDGVTSSNGRYVVKISHRGVFPAGVSEGTIWLFDAVAIKAGIRDPKMPIASPVALAKLAATVNGIEFIGERGNIISKPTWLDDGRLAFLGRDGRENRQLFQVDIESREVRALTPVDQDVVDYVWSAGQFTYLAGVPVPPESRWSSAGTDLPDIVNGTGQPLTETLFPNWRDTYHDTVDLQIWQVRGERAAPVLAAGTTKPLTVTTRFAVETMAVSPDGTQLVTIGSDGSAQPPLTQLAPQDVAHGLQYRLIDLIRGTNEALLTRWIDNAGIDRYRASWAPNGKSIAVTETFVATGDTGQARDPQRCDVAIVSLSDRMAQCLSAPRDNQHGYLYSLHWQASEGELRVRYRRSGTYLYADRILRRTGEVWKPTKQWESPSAWPLELTVKESLNEPPVLLATDPVTEKSRVIFDPNPWIRDISLGSVRPYAWADKHGRKISGVLVLPPRYVSGKRYPLVIQTHGFDPYAFFVTGGSATAHAGRAIAARNLVVLQVGEPGKPYSWTWQDSRENGTNVYLAAIDQLDADGIIDPKHVGISGYSLTGRYVSDAITFAPNRFAAAVLSNTDPVSLANYFFFVDAPQRPIAEIVDAGAKPYGEGLEKWLERSPAFSTNKIRAPVLISAGGPLHLLHLWSLYAALRDQEKPVDLQYIRTGEHNFMMPLHKLAHQEAMVDWFDFWLNNHEDTSPGKAGQYQRWRRLREMFEAANH
jgi:dipeptidyl aminopeptidase/acylaminoacyl peptidase